MSLSARDLFPVGTGPSSSHTVGPVRAAATGAGGHERDGHPDIAVRVRTELFGSIDATGPRHGCRAAVVLGLVGESLGLETSRDALSADVIDVLMHILTPSTTSAGPGTRTRSRT